MRTNIVIDDDLMNRALRATGIKTKKEAVEEGLKTLVALNEIPVEAESIFGLWKDKDETENVKEYVRGLRRGRSF